MLVPLVLVMGVGGTPQQLAEEVQHAVVVAAEYEFEYQGPVDDDDGHDGHGHSALPAVLLGGVGAYAILAWEHMPGVGCRSTHAPLHVHTAEPRSTRARAHVPPELHDGECPEILAGVQVPASKECAVVSESPQTQEQALRHRSVLHDESSPVPPQDDRPSQNNLRVETFAMDGLKQMGFHQLLLDSHV